MGNDYQAIRIRKNGPKIMKIQVKFGRHYNGGEIIFIEVTY